MRPRFDDGAKYVYVSEGQKPKSRPARTKPKKPRYAAVEIESMVMQLNWEDLPEKEIAYRARRSLRTIKYHIAKLLRRHKCRSRVGLALWWERNRPAPAAEKL